LAKALDVAARMGSKAPLAVRHCIEAVNTGSEMPVEEGCYLEATLFGLCCTSEDMREGTRAFIEKRKPEFKGC
jgi:enoyl-CoA hydratase